MNFALSGLRSLVAVADLRPRPAQRALQSLHAEIRLHGQRQSPTRSEQSDTLQTRLNQARGTGLPEIVRFCDGLRRDEKAVNATVVLPWSNGQVEGQFID